MRMNLKSTLVTLGLVAFLIVGCRENGPARVESPAGAQRDTPLSTTSTAAATPVVAAPVETPPPTAGEVACEPERNRLCPVDEGVADPGFVRFRSEMLSAVRRKDAAAVMRIVDPKIRTSFGDGGGIQDFRGQWKPESADSALWPELESILTLGGKFLGEGEERSFWAPYVYSAWPDPYDAFMHVAAIRSGVPIHAKPDSASEVKATVSWQILEIADSGGSDEPGWRRVAIPGGTAGWVSERDVRSPIGYRAGFSNRTGEWRMEALVAGD